ncbi:nitrilase [Ekhidna lutea]|uniref:Nitrilase n=1 Tax=Ekhidna lutea TaxID=447679 RepID=A0A239K7A9_EKHLU|nr:carbon-nitrogen hydrolase family protein [Ekhidna lutea]SNT13572.1 nitrilase [Ekhidna lutea]
MNQQLKIGLAQISPIWLNREKTLDKVADFVSKAADNNAKLVVFGEALVPGYPFWLDRLNGAEFNSTTQKQIHAIYALEAVCIEKGHLDTLCKLAKSKNISIYLGTIERPNDRGGHSLYCSMVFISNQGEIKSVHRKLMPTYEERLSWSPGDGHGLVTHQVPPFTVGGLNCWENWLPLARSALYAQGENLHVSIWPGNKRNTEQLIPVIAQESRSYVVGVSGLFSAKDIPDEFPFSKEMRNVTTEALADGGSCIAAPDGSWVIEPLVNKEDLIIAEIDYRKVLEERQNFDPSGHYSRPDVLSLNVNWERQSIIK